jgi:hypothetical protein
MDSKMPAKGRADHRGRIVPISPDVAAQAADGTVIKQKRNSIDRQIPDMKNLLPGSR